MVTNDLIIELKIFDKDFKEQIKPYLNKYDCIKNTGLKPSDLEELGVLFYKRLNCCDNLLSVRLYEYDTLLRLQNDVIISVNSNTFQSTLIDVLLSFPNKFGIQELK